jgi:cytochrome P450
VAPAFTNRHIAAPAPRIRSIADELVVALDAAPTGDPVNRMPRSLEFTYNTDRLVG